MPPPEGSIHFYILSITIIDKMVRRMRRVRRRTRRGGNRSSGRRSSGRHSSGRRSSGRHSQPRWKRWLGKAVGNVNMGSGYPVDMWGKPLNANDIPATRLARTLRTAASKGKHLAGRATRKVGRGLESAYRWAVRTPTPKPYYPYYGDV